MDCTSTRKSHEAYSDLFITLSKMEGAPGNPSQCHVAACIGGQFGGGWIRVYLWLNPFTVLLKVSPHC